MPGAPRFCLPCSGNLSGPGTLEYHPWELKLSSRGTLTSFPGLALSDITDKVEMHSLPKFSLLASAYTLTFLLFVTKLTALLLKTVTKDAFMWEI